MNNKLNRAEQISILNDSKRELFNLLMNCQDWVELMNNIDDLAYQLTEGVCKDDRVTIKNMMVDRVDMIIRKDY